MNNKYLGLIKNKMLFTVVELTRHTEILHYWDKVKSSIDRQMYTVIQEKLGLFFDLLNV
jgi:hypothetical protein